MKKTRHLAKREGKPQATVLRESLAACYTEAALSRDFALDGVFEGNGTSIADVPDEELLTGFGERGSVSGYRPPVAS